MANDLADLLTNQLTLAPASPRAVTTIESLPSETLSHIFECFIGPPPTVDYFGSRRAKSIAITAPLLAASLVCRRWRDLAQRALNTDLVFPRYPEWHASPAYGRFRVRSLTLYEHRDTSVISSVNAIGKMLKACPGLERLYLVGEAEGQLSWGVFRHANLRELSTLVIRCLEDFCDPTDLTTPLACHLTNLSLWLDGEQPPSAASLNALFASSVNTLTALSIRLTAPRTSSFLPLIRLLTPSFRLVAPHLRHLTLESKTEPASLDLSLCGCLETLSFPEVPIQEDLFPNSAGLASALRSLPSTPTLRRISLGAVPIALLPAVVPLLELPSLSKLRLVELPQIGLEEARESLTAEVWRRWEERGLRVDFLDAQIG